MKHIKLERVKSLVLIVLVASSVIQVGILWYYQNHRLPISFLSTLYTMFNQKTPPDLSGMKEEVILPVRIIVSDEYAISRWVINSESKHFRRLGIEAYSYIQNVLSDDFTQKPEKLPGYRWDIISKPIVFEFGTSMDIDIIKFLSNLKKTTSPNAPPGILKMVIAPWSDQNENNTIYFLYGEDLYKYTLPFIKNGFDRESYEKFMLDLAEDKSLVNYNAYGDIDPNNNLGYPINSDVPIVVRKPYNISFPVVYGYIPDNLILRYNENGDPDPSVIARTLLGSDFKNFDHPEVDSQGIVTLKNVNNIYKQYKNGLMEYSYWSQVPAQDKGELRVALENAFEFIAEKKSLFSKSANYRLKLTDVSQAKDKSSYEFKLDYMLNGMPVFFKDANQDGSRNIQSAITIQANSKGIVSCRWYVRNFKVEQAEASLYNIYFDKFLENYKASYTDLKGSKGININDIHTAYLDSYEEKKHTLSPVWSLKLIDQAGAELYRFIDIPSWEVN